MTSEDVFEKIFARLMQVRIELSEETFRAAAGAALVAIGRVVLHEAERRAKRPDRAKAVTFPLSRVLRSISEREE